MTYTALYRRLRPQRFSEVIGQSHITQTLKQAVANQRLAHAYLFTGPRGTGKTSMAKIMAKAANCPQRAEAEPCNQCELCRSITEGRSLDVLEIDAASNRGVEEIRELREKVKYAPTEAQYKVYIIDEVHMLTTEAFNALLKTLEEPPPHVLFILATTEPHKIPMTILSRCQRFDFHQISQQAMVSHLRSVVQQLGVEVEEEAILHIARVSEGGMRDALSLLDQVLAFADGKVTLEEVLAITGGLPRYALGEMWWHVTRRDAAAALQLLHQWLDSGKEPAFILEELSHYGRELLLGLSAPALEEAQQILQEERTRQLLSSLTVEELMARLKFLQKALQDVKWAQPRLILEMAIIQMTHPSNQPDAAGADEGLVKQLESQLKQLQARLDQLEKQLQHRPEEPPPPARRPEAVRRVKQGISPQVQQVWAQRSEEHTRLVKEKWGEILERIRSQWIFVHAWLVDAEVAVASPDAVLLVFKTPIHRETTEKATNRQVIARVMYEVLGKKYNMVTLMQEDWAELSKEAPPSSAGGSEKASPNPEEMDPVQTAISWFGKDKVEIKE